MPQSSVSSTTLSVIRAELANREPATRAQAIEALAVLADTRGLITALGSSDAYVRRTAVKGLAEQPGVFLTWRLGRLRLDPDQNVRGAVAEALTRRTSRLALRALRRIISADPSLQVRFLAIMGLAQMELPGVDEILRTAMTQDVEAQLRAMARALLRRREGRRKQETSRRRENEWRRD
jgi:HEAT repeat protein